MDQQQQQQQPPPTGGVPGPAGRRLHIAHRRSPSELTPLMSMFQTPGSKLNPSPFSLEPLATSRALIAQKLSVLWSSYLLDRAATATATANPSYPPIHEYGNDAGRPARRWWSVQSFATKYGQHVATDGLSVSQPASTATKHSDGNTEPTNVTPSKPVRPS
ncbi:hypothetical protein NUW58_g5207 [Xylaria curta]|uniref:Uncharacterized protein n=1 Tax=Xylaria curta TaxID=42375 RepID=A0ACC1P385_9PEZI|nr:hypothetical protein NUW58_g5207 [Xylaria curta]